MRQLTEATPDHLTSREYDEARLSLHPNDEAAAHAMQACPLPAALGGEGTIKDDLVQARPLCLTRV